MHDPSNNDSAAIERLRERFSKHAIYRFLEFDVVELSLDRCVLRAGFQDQFDNGGGAIHGGVLAMLADIAVACALSTNFDGKMGFATSNLNIHFLSRARSSILIDGRIIKKGSTVCVGNVEIRDDNGTIVAIVTCDFILTTARFSSETVDDQPPVPRATTASTS